MLAGAEIREALTFGLRSIGIDFLKIYYVVKARTRPGFMMLSGSIDDLMARIKFSATVHL